ncbi:hydroxyacid dehydrogenase, partial [Fournierella massiliensis]
MAKILVTENVHPVGPDLLKAAGHQVVFADRDMDIIRREIVDADAVFVRIIDLDEALLSTAKKLKIVSKHGVGYDNIDIEYCKRRGIPVTLALNANSQSVAEHAVALMMALAKNLVPVSRAYAQIGFAAKNSAPGMEVWGKTVGVIGLGHIGTRFARMCAGGFGMKVLAYDPYVKTAPEGVTLTDDLEGLLRQSDVVSLHCNLTDETRRILNKERLALMKPTAILINCARGPMVDEEALAEALKSGQLAGAGLDVTDPEPVPEGSPLFQIPNLIITPH